MRLLHLTVVEEENGIDCRIRGVVSSSSDHSQSLNKGVTMLYAEQVMSKTNKYLCKLGNVIFHGFVILEAIR